MLCPICKSDNVEKDPTEWGWLGYCVDCGSFENIDGTWEESKCSKDSNEHLKGSDVTLDEKIILDEMEFY